jgi:hypothetical protein
MYIFFFSCLFLVWYIFFSARNLIIFVQFIRALSNTFLLVNGYINSQYFDNLFLANENISLYSSVIKMLRDIMVR